MSISNIPNQEPTMDRRPIASRKWRIWQITAQAMARAGVRPNGISIFGMIAGLLAGVALYLTGIVHDDLARRMLWLLAAVLVQLRLLANMLDGMVAVESGAASPVGELYNEIPDRISDAAVLIGLGYAAEATPMLGYLAACLAVFVAYVRAAGRAAGAPNDFCGPMAKPHRMFTVTLLAIYLAVSPRAWRPSPQAISLCDAALLLIILGCVVTAMRRLRHVARALRTPQGDR